ncbi:MAG: site-specific integrase [Comamonadaceae bacterium]|nr:site-specific integrase [Comamonadaceae bacterium]
MPTIRQRGEKYQCLVRVKRNGVIAYQESRTFVTRRQAVDWGRRLEERIREQGVDTYSKSKLPLGEYLRKYADHLDKTTTRRDKVVQSLYRLAAAFDAVAVDAPSRVFTEWAVRRREDGVAASTVQHDLALLRAALNAAKAVFGVSVDGASVSEAVEHLRHRKIIGASRWRDRRVSDAELAQVCERLENRNGHPSTYIPVATIAKLALAFPRRLGELCGMRWEDYDSQRGIITLRGTKSPRKLRDEVVPVPPVARDIMDGLERIDERILPYKSASVSTAFTRAVAACQVDNLRFHDLRHEGISRLLEAGYTIPEVASISGHVNWQMLRRYTHIGAAALAEKMYAHQKR